MITALVCCCLDCLQVLLAEDDRVVRNYDALMAIIVEDYGWISSLSDFSLQILLEVARMLVVIGASSVRSIVRFVLTCEVIWCRQFDIPQHITFCFVHPHVWPPVRLSTVRSIVFVLIRPYIRQAVHPLSSDCSAVQESFIHSLVRTCACLLDPQSASPSLRSIKCLFAHPTACREVCPGVRT